MSEQFHPNILAFLCCCRHFHLQFTVWIHKNRFVFSCARKVKQKINFISWRREEFRAQKCVPKICSNRALNFPHKLYKIRRQMFYVLIGLDEQTINRESPASLNYSYRFLFNIHKTLTSTNICNFTPVNNVTIRWQ